MENENNIVDNAEDIKKSKPNNNRKPRAPRSDSDRMRDNLASKKRLEEIHLRNKSAKKVALNNSANIGDSKTFFDAMDQFNMSKAEVEPPTFLAYNTTADGQKHLKASTLEYTECGVGDFFLLSANAYTVMKSKYKIKSPAPNDEGAKALFKEKLAAGHPLLSCTKNIIKLDKISNNIVIGKPQQGDSVIPQYYEKTMLKTRGDTNLKIVRVTLETAKKVKTRSDNILPNNMGNGDLPKCPFDIILEFGAMIALIGNGTNTREISNYARLMKNKFNLVANYISVAEDFSETEEENKPFFTMAMAYEGFTKHLGAGIIFPITARTALSIDSSVILAEQMDKCMKLAQSMAESSGMGNWATVKYGAIKKNKKKTPSVISV